MRVPEAEQGLGSGIIYLALPCFEDLWYAIVRLSKVMSIRPVGSSCCNLGHTSLNVRW